MIPNALTATKTPTSPSMVDGEILPPIKIQLFSESPEGDRLMQSALLDRRLAMTQAQTFSGGITAAIDTYQTQPTPDMVVIECRQLGSGLLDSLAGLSDVCDPSTQVLLIGQVNDIDFYRELISRGVGEYILMPPLSVDLIRSISKLYERGGGKFSARTVAVLGARGGVGSSTVAQNLSYALSRRVKTVLVDLDMAYGTAGLNFNQDPPEGMATALAEPDRLDSVLLDRIMVSCSEHLRLLAAPANLTEDYCADPADYNEVIHRVKATAPAVVLDIPKQWNPWISNALAQADEVVLVATPDLVSLRNAKNIVDALRSLRPTDALVKLVVNQTSLPGRREIPNRLFSKAVGLAPDATLEFDAKLFDAAISRGQLAMMVNPDSRFAVSMDQLAAMVGGHRAQLLSEMKKPNKIMQWMRSR